MTKRATFSQADVQRAARAMKAVGEAIAGVEMRPDGTWRVLTLKDAEQEARADETAWDRKLAWRKSA